MIAQVELASLDRFVALDVEIATRIPLAVCAIGVARFESGLEASSYQSLVKFEGRVKYTDIHGLTRADLRDAPSWGSVWRRVGDVLQGIHTVVAYRAAFDRAALMTMCARSAIQMPRLRFVCAAKLYQARCGRSVPLSTALADMGLSFPGRPHDPLADARAAAALVLKLHVTAEKDGTIQLSKSPRTDDPATLRSAP